MLYVVQVENFKRGGGGGCDVKLVDFVGRFGVVPQVRVGTRITRSRFTPVTSQ